MSKEITIQQMLDAYHEADNNYNGMVNIRNLFYSLSTNPSKEMLIEILKKISAFDFCNDIDCTENSCLWAKNKLNEAAETILSEFNGRENK